ncbi:hypothetical protein VNO78_13881 [Psophocarpus tetragonolobus]|uniref:Uncharacterized protein n=1 Tax=Psophocarpus tetragonolobus TaxID=3891 RepID=A0AAN9SRN4_PSOTE
MQLITSHTTQHNSTPHHTTPHHTTPPPSLFTLFHFSLPHSPSLNFPTLLRKLVSLSIHLASGKSCF